MLHQEIEVINKKEIPEYLYHLVPYDIFLKFTDKNGNYDCRNRKEWGMNEGFIHTTSSCKVLKERVADYKWKNYDLSKKFILLKIESDKIEGKITYAIYNKIKYYHIWGNILNESFDVLKVERNKDGTFIL